MASVAETHVCEHNGGRTCLDAASRATVWRRREVLVADVHARRQAKVLIEVRHAIFGELRCQGGALGRTVGVAQEFDRGGLEPLRKVDVVRPAKRALEVGVDVKVILTPPVYSVWEITNEIYRVVSE